MQNRLAERRALDRVVTAVRGGRSRVLVVHGEPGVGKTVLLDYLSEQAAGCQVARVTGMQSEMELAFAGLHQLLAPMLERVDDLPVPQRDALRTVFGMETGPVPDRFLVGLAVLNLLSEAAEERPLVCLVDDVQWLDQASSQVLGFVARRLAADPVALVFVAREPAEELTGLPELVVNGLREEDARALLDAALTGPLDARVRDQIVAETRGNPLALLELPRGLTPAELAGGFGLPAAVPLTDRIEDSFRRQLDAMPPDTLRLLRLAAAETSGDPALLWRAAERLGIPFQAAAPAKEAGLAKFGARVRFRHPLLRSAAYRSASLSQRLEMHNALAEVIDPLADPDRRAWHRAQAAAGPDEAVAAELEHCAGRARDRGGLAAAAAFLERSVVLTADLATRAERTLAAAQAKLQAGAFDSALGLVAAAEAGPLDELQGAQADLLRGRIAFASGPGSDAPPLLLKAAKRLESLDLDLSRQTYVDAWQAAVFAGHLVGAGDLLEVSHVARALPPPAHPPRPVDLLLDGFAVLAIDGPTAAAPLLRQATAAFARADLPVEESLQWGWLARVADKTLWDDAGLSITSGQVRLAREAGALDHLSIVLNMMAMDAVWGGDLVAAASVVTEEDAVREATGSRNLPYAAMMLAAYRGREQETTPLIQATAEQVMAGGQGAALTNAYWMAAILYNGLGRYADALTAASQASEHRHLYASSWAWPELIEAAVRADGVDEAHAALDLLAGTTRAGGTDLGLGVEARCRALLAEGDVAEGYYREALDRLARTRRRPDLARAHLLYGEWLRRERRRGDAQQQLRTAYWMLDEMGMEAFAERARRELRATGETIRTHRSGGAGDRTTLTAQEARVARLAADGRSNPEIAARLFISTRTVQYHLSKVFSKLGIGSRTELHRVLPGEPDLAAER
jgi:DNA-binding CsgD family transcriptional regulator